MYVLWDWDYKERKRGMMATDQERPGVEERYEGAVHASRILLEEHRTGAADVLVAAGWSLSRTGMALLRLHSEWQAAAKPERMTRAQVEALAVTIKQGDEAARANRDRENGELDRLRASLADHISKMPGDDQAAREDWERERSDITCRIIDLESLYERGWLPLDPIKPPGNPVARARAESERWYANELRILALSLKSRPTVWAQLLPWALAKGVPEQQVAQALFHWLDPVCGHCDGHGLHKAKDAPALSAKQCRACNGTGSKEIPDGGFKVLSHISQCLTEARVSLRKRLHNG